MKSSLSNEDIANLLIDMSNRQKDAIKNKNYDIAKRCEMFMNDDINTLLHRGLKSDEILTLMKKVSEDNKNMVRAEAIK